MKRTCNTFSAVVAAVAVAIWDGRGKATATDTIEAAGDVLQFVLPVTAASLTLGYRDGQGALQLGESLAVTMAATYAIKYGFESSRPNGGNQSFPSGHTSISFSSAEFMRERYGWKYGVPAYAAASFVAYSRVESGYHHPRDVVVGAGIGILSSYLFTKPYKGWNVSLQGDTKGFGVRFIRKF